MRWVVVLIVVVPLVELLLLLQIDRLIGFWATLGITLVTGFVGGTLAKREGLKVWRAWRSAMEELRPPEQGVIDGVLVLLGGAFLITPGVLTDLAGFTLLLRPTRRLIAARVRKALDRKLQAGQVQIFGFDGMGRAGAAQVIETEGEAAPPGEVAEPPAEASDQGRRLG